jgi:hypothetical protein
MPRHPFFSAYGLIVLLATSWAAYQGWPSSSWSAHSVSPKSIRDNPGAYRPIYSYYHRYSGGK